MFFHYGHIPILFCSDIAVGEHLLCVGACIGAAEIGLLASIGRQNVHVYAKPIVAVLSTGTEV
jgi:molybdopterin molybdotransferase